MSYVGKEFRFCLCCCLELLHLGETGVTLDGLAPLRAARTLKTVFLSSDWPSPAIQARLRQLVATLPRCELVVNHLPPHVYLGTE